MAEAIKEKDKEEHGPDWALRGARHHFTSASQNTDLMKDIGNVTLLFKGQTPNFHLESPKKIILWKFKIHFKVNFFLLLFL